MLQRAFLCSLRLFFHPASSIVLMMNVYDEHFSLLSESDTHNTNFHDYDFHDETISLSPFLRSIVERYCAVNQR